MTPVDVPILSVTNSTIFDSMGNLARRGGVYGLAAAKKRDKEVTRLLGGQGSTEPTDDKEKALWVKLKRLFEPDTDDLLELQGYIHDPLTWRLYDASGVHHVSTET
ncbi:hypothetical protein Tco_0749041 [Tanacetum coccineum]|uniref:Uncharacterized protein n=1 Tax=Tanacetum coccineum TaxID=301880 RepID=A0ABQ4YXK5_9ASTR